MRQEETDNRLQEMHRERQRHREVGNREESRNSGILRKKRLESEEHKDTSK